MRVIMAMTIGLVLAAAMPAHCAPPHQGATASPRLEVRPR